ncbi:MAG TPA: alcohol dehydrogenase catalytic domain-containing protein [Phototrophicaceae bacterium]|nr:alcohol dehydrogenase catalytic domain-containing protein [Phototrophicaceae bacterium]
MRALVLDGSLSFNSRVPDPVAHGNQALLKIRTAGICNTDLELVGGYMNFSGILGHEFVAEVVSGSDEWIGKRVVGEINVADGTCDFCQRGIPSQCRNRTTVGIDRHDGAFADYLALTTNNLHIVPDGVSDDAAVFTEPLAAALQSLEAVHISPRDRVIVLGAGKLGLLVAQVVRLIGADIGVIVRREKPAKLLNHWRIPALARSEVQQHQAQIVIDCTGTAAGFADALELVEPRGTIILKSTYHDLPQINMTRIAVDEIRVIGSRCGPFDAALRLLDAGLVDAEALIEARYSLDAGLQAFEQAAQPGVLKVILDIGEVTR